MKMASKNLDKREKNSSTSAPMTGPSITTEAEARHTNTCALEETVFSPSASIITPTSSPKPSSSASASASVSTTADEDQKETNSGASTPTRLINRTGPSSYFDCGGYGYLPTTTTTGVGVGVGTMSMKMSLSMGSLNSIKNFLSPNKTEDVNEEEEKKGNRNGNGNGNEMNEPKPKNDTINADSAHAAGVESEEGDVQEREGSVAETEIDATTAAAVVSEAAAIVDDSSHSQSVIGEDNTVVVEEEDDDDDGDEIESYSDLSDLSRNIWIVTTAALPWRTGTAINPFLRALYLVRRRLDLYNLDADVDTDTDNDNVNDTDTEMDSGAEEKKEVESKPKSKANKAGKVTLVIPWLVDPEDTAKLYNGHITKEGEEGKQQQLEWIRNYACEKCDMKDEMDHLNILFYSAAYFTAFGSIFPTEDICSLIPHQEADVAILEEPEHLNWFRMPKEGTKKIKGGANESGDGTGREDDEDEYAGPASFCLRKLQVHEQMKVDSNVVDMNLNQDDGSNSAGSKLTEGTSSGSGDDDDSGSRGGDGSTSGQTEEEVKLNDGQNSHGSQLDSAASNEDDDADADTPNYELGWAHKFKFVVGVIHTNYAAYMKQYGIGTSIVAAPAISALSSMVVRAYCHKVVRLSGVIPSYAKWKEVTCNVHGVRGDFLLPKSSPDSDAAETGAGDADNSNDNDCAPIYFIGKLLWAKGFDRMLKVQDKFRLANPKREYFPIDVYGGGPDETAIVRAFHGRLNDDSHAITRSPTSSEDGDDDENENRDDNEKDVVSDIFSKDESIRDQLRELTKHSGDTEPMPKAYDDAKNYINMGFELVVPSGQSDDDTVSRDDVVVMERRKLVHPAAPAPVPSFKHNPLSIISDVSEKSVGTGIATTKAVKTLADSALKAGFAMTFTSDDNDRGGYDQEIQTQASFRFDPPKSIYELRRNPIPARFLGVKDHAQLREMPYKIFLNPSITEVLCTTTAEALAMGKFAIIPKHTSNEFFLQFPNCLAYSTVKECVEKIQWALDNDPTPLTEEQAHIFTWHAATDRLIEASRITKKEARDRSSRGCDKADSRMAWLHSEGGKKGKYIKTFFESPKATNKKFASDGDEPDADAATINTPPSKLVK